MTFKDRFDYGYKGFSVIISLISRYYYKDTLKGN